MTQQHHQATFPLADIGQLFAFNPVSFMSAAKYYEAFTQMVVDMNAEAFRFINYRLEEDMGLASKFAECHTPEDVAKTQFSFLEKMTSDYTQEAQKMIELTMSAAQNGAGQNGARHS